MWLLGGASTILVSLSSCMVWAIREAVAGCWSIRKSLCSCGRLAEEYETSPPSWTVGMKKCWNEQTGEAYAEYSRVVSRDL